MLVNISWSNELSKKITDSFSEFLQMIFQSIDVSSLGDIKKGENWNKKIENLYRKSTLSFFCITKENINSGWLLYELGIAQTISKNIVQLIFDISLSDLPEPFASYPVITFSKSDYKKLVTTINDELYTHRLDPKIIEKIFNSIWNDFEREVKDILNIYTLNFNDTITNINGTDLLKQILDRLDRIENKLNKI